MACGPPSLPRGLPQSRSRREAGGAAQDARESLRGSYAGEEWHYLEDRVGYYLLIRHGGHRYVCYVALIFLVTYTCGNYNCCKCALQW